MLRFVSSSVLVVAFCTSLFAQPEMETFTHKSGKKTYEGVLLSIDEKGRNVIILTPRKFALNSFDEATQEKIRKQLASWTEASKEKKAEDDAAAKEKAEHRAKSLRIKASGRGAKTTDDFKIEGRPSAMAYVYEDKSGFGAGIFQVAPVSPGPVFSSVFHHPIFKSPTLALHVWIIIVERCRWRRKIRLG